MGFETHGLRVSGEGSRASIQLAVLFITRGGLRLKTSG